MLPEALTILTGADIPALAFKHPDPFDPNRVEPVQNQVAVSGKPLGGAWLALLDENGRTAWETASDLRVTPVLLDPEARVLRLDSAADLDALHAALPPPVRLADYLGIPEHLIPPMFGLVDGLCDWERLAEDVDAVWGTADAIAATRHRFDGGPSLSLWDVESVLVLHGDVVTPVERPAPVPRT